MPYVGGRTGEGRVQAVGADGRRAQTACARGKGRGPRAVAGKPK